jgi:hypothetical protein
MNDLDLKNVLQLLKQTLFSQQQPNRYRRDHPEARERDGDSGFPICAAPNQSRCDRNNEREAEHARPERRTKEQPNGEEQNRHAQPSAVNSCELTLELIVF